MLRGGAVGPASRILQGRVGTEITVTRGTVFNRHGMPPSPAALLFAVSASQRSRGGS